jgi:hypothetical protein
MQEFTPKTRKRLRADTVKSTHLKPSCHRTGTTTAPRPKPECDPRCQRCTQDPPKSHLQNKWAHHSWSKRNAVACPRNGAGLPPTVPSPGANPPIYPSSLPLASGNPLSSISPKSHGFFFFSIVRLSMQPCIESGTLFLRKRASCTVKVFS